MELRNSQNINIGIDIIKNERLKNKINNHKFISRILGTKELELFNRIKNQQRKIEFLAGRFSAKESITKAINFKPSFNKINIINNNVEIDQNYKQKLQESMKIKDIKIQISISHEKEFTISSCICIINYDR